MPTLGLRNILGLPRHAPLPSYDTAVGPHGAPTITWTKPPTGSHGAATSTWASPVTANEASATAG
jgi:hypothetical protein